MWTDQGMNGWSIMSLGSDGYCEGVLTSALFVFVLSISALDA